MRKFRIIHGYNNGDMKWCVVCVDHGLRDAPICSPVFDTADEAERALDELTLLEAHSTPSTGTGLITARLSQGKGLRSRSREGAMFEYRAFLIGHDGRIKAAQDLRCNSDADALDQARGILTDYPIVEVWSEDRRVATIPGARFSSGGEARVPE